MVLGVCMPEWLNYITYCEKNSVKDNNRTYATLFHMLNYGFAFLVFKLPEYIFGENGQETCLAQNDEIKELKV